MTIRVLNDNYLRCGRISNKTLNLKLNDITTTNGKSSLVTQETLLMRTEINSDFCLQYSE